MFNYFYHGNIRKIIAVFGSLFNNIKVVRVDEHGRVDTVIQVPIRYGPIDKFLIQNTEQRANIPKTIDQRYYETWPKMSYEWKSINYDGQRARNILNKTVVPSTRDPFKSSSTFSPAPYKLGFSLYIGAKNQTDALQIYEQIAAYFRPHMIVTIKNTIAEAYDIDVPVTLTGHSFEDNWEGDFESFRLVQYTLDFELSYQIDGPAQTEYESAVQKFVSDKGLEDYTPTFCDLPKTLDPTHDHMILKVLVDYYPMIDIQGFDDDFTQLIGERTKITASPHTARDHKDVDKYNVNYNSKHQDIPEED